MASLSASVTTLLNALNIGTAKPADNTGGEANGAATGDNFSALLTIGKDTQVPHDVAKESAPTDARRTPTDNDATRSRGTERTLSRRQDDDSARKVPANDRPEAPRDRSNKNAAPHSRDIKSDAPEKPADRPAQASDNNADTQIVRNAKQTGGTNDAAPQEVGTLNENNALPAEDKPKIEANVDELNLLLLSILQALGITPPAAQSSEGATTPIETATVASDAATDIVASAATPSAKPAESLLPVATEDAVEPVEVAALLTQGQVPAPAADTQLLAKLEKTANLVNALVDTLQAVTPSQLHATQTSPQNSKIETLTTALEGLTQKLSNLLHNGKQEAAENIVPAVASDTQPDAKPSNAETLTQTGNKLSALLQTLTNTIKNTAPKAPSNSDAAAPVEVQTAAPATATAPLAPDTSFKAPSLLDAVAAKFAVKDDEKKEEPARTSQVVATPVIETKINPATIAQPTAVAAVTNTNNVQGVANNAGGDLSNGGGNNGGGAQNQPAPVTPAGAGVHQAQNASSAYKSDFARALEQADRQPIIEQVAFHIRTAKATGDSKISIQLNPEELGKVEVKIHIGADGKTGVIITADNKNALETMQRDAQGLARALNDAGLQTDTGSLSFNLRGGEQQHAGSQGDGNGRSHGVNIYQKIQPEDEAEIALNTLSKSYVVNLADGLDIKI